MVVIRWCDANCSMWYCFPLFVLNVYSHYPLFLYLLIVASLCHYFLVGFGADAHGQNATKAAGIGAVLFCVSCVCFVALIDVLFV
jgi:uncharacterized membrane protein YhaH (DUF805 family)